MSRIPNPNSILMPSGMSPNTLANSRSKLPRITPMWKTPLWTASLFPPTMIFPAIAPGRAAVTPRKTPKRPRWKNPPDRSRQVPAPAVLAVAPIPAPILPARLTAVMVPTSVQPACKTFMVEARLPPKSPKMPKSRKLRAASVTGVAIPLHSGIPAIRRTLAPMKPTAAIPPAPAAMMLIPPIGRPIRILPCLVAHRRALTTPARFMTIGAATAAAGIPRTPTRLVSTRPASATPTMDPADILPPATPPRQPIRIMIRPPRYTILPVLRVRRMPPRAGRRQARRWGIL